jgi:predicted alpha/beta hydrolase family esterase
MRYLFIPGIGNSDIAHWQSLWEKDLGSAATRIAPKSWDNPEADDWTDAISRAASPGMVLVGHSLGCLAAAMWLAGPNAVAIAGAFLVAPPQPTASVFPDVARSFNIPQRVLSVPALVVGSSNDPFSSEPEAQGVALAWGASYLSAGMAGHINSSARLRDWTFGRKALARFVTEIDPQSD